MGVVPERFAVMTIDPGGRTGVAQGLFKAQRTVGLTLKRATRLGAIRAATVEGPFVYQATLLKQSWERFLFHAHVEQRVPRRSVLLAVEDFQLRQVAVELSPVEVFSAFWALMTVDLGGSALPRLVQPSASDAFGFATLERMREWGFGREHYGVISREGDHRQSACRHLALMVNYVLGESRLVA